MPPIRRLRAQVATGGPGFKPHSPCGLCLAPVLAADFPARPNETESLPGQNAACFGLSFASHELLRPMSNVLAAAAAAKIQEIRSQTLATMLAIVAPAAGLASGQGQAGQGRQATEAAMIRAVVVEMQGATRALVQLAGGYAEVELPPALLRQAAADPSLLKPGSLLMLPADVPARPVAGPATAVVASLANMPPPPAGTGPFPPGSLGQALTRLTGLALPAAEAAPRFTPSLPPSSALRSATLPAGLPAPLAEAALQSAARQLPLAQVITGLLHRLAAPAGGAEPADATALPPLLRNALAALMPLRTSPAALATPEGLQQAIARSGLFLESGLAKLPAEQAPIADLKAALSQIRQTAGQTGAEPAAAEIARLAEGGLERIKLMQLASLPAHAEIGRSEDQGQGFRLALSIPLAPQGPDRPQTAMMGLLVEHQPETPQAPEDALAKEGQNEAQPFPWKVRIALDLEETGPVEAEIGLRGQSVSVQLWAEQPGMAQWARRSIGDLHAALSGAAFEVVKLDVHDGRATPRPSMPHPYRDRRA